MACSWDEFHHKCHAACMMRSKWYCHIFRELMGYEMCMKRVILNRRWHKESNSKKWQRAICMTIWDNTIDDISELIYKPPTQYIKKSHVYVYRIAEPKASLSARKAIEGWNIRSIYSFIYLYLNIIYYICEHKSKESIPSYARPAF